MSEKNAKNYNKEFDVLQPDVHSTAERCCLQLNSDGWKKGVHFLGINAFF